MPDEHNDSRDLLGLDEIFRTFDDGRGSDDGGAAVAVPAPHKPAPNASAIALPKDWRSIASTLRWSE
jgi:hypothetical protein